MNPELQRNVWLETSPRRLAWVAVAVALVYGSAVLLAQLSSRPDALAAMGTAGGLMFFCSAYVWGVRNAGQSVMVEISQRTWDFQRLSAISPWAMTWGKLVGATSLAWIVALAGWVVSAAVRPGENLGPTLFSALAVAILLQAMALWATLVGVRKARAEGRVPSLRSVVGGFLLALFGLWLISSFGRLLGDVGHFNGLGSVWLWGRGVSMGWWGVSLPVDVFALLSTLAFAAWALVGAWRLMRLEMQMRNTPWIWIAFLIFLAVYVGGLASPRLSVDPQAVELHLSELLRSGGVALVLGLTLYAAAFVEPADRVRLRRFVETARRGQFKTALDLTPLILPAAAAGLIAAVVFATWAGGVHTAIQRQGELNGGGLAWLSPVTVLAGFAFVLRDVGVVFFFRFGPRPRRGDFSAVVGLVLVHLVSHALAAALGDNPARAALWPMGAHAEISLISGLIQAAVVWWLAWRRVGAPERPAD